MTIEESREVMEMLPNQEQTSDLAEYRKKFESPKIKANIAVLVGRKS